MHQGHPSPALVRLWMVTMSAVGSVDLTRLAHDMTEISGGSYVNNCKKLVSSSVAQIEFLAMAYAPRRTGHLRESIHSEITRDGMGGSVISGASYGGFVEMGTGTRGEFPGKPIVIMPKNGKYLKFKAGGRTIFAKKVVSQGMAPRPYLRPAFERVVTPMVAGIADLSVLTIVKGPNAPETLRAAPATGWSK